MDKQTYDREKALYLYISGLELGDFDQMGVILKQAETDPALEQMIMETHEVYASEMPKPSAEDAAKVREMIERLMGEQKGSKQNE